MSDNPAPELGMAGSQARSAILDLIASGTLPPGTKLPSERQLSAQLSFSRSVLRDALSSLEEEEILESFPWRGWFVKSDRMVEQVALRSFSELARERGLRPGARVIKQMTRSVTIEESRLLRLPPGSEVLEILRLRTLDSFAACLDESIVALSRAPHLEESDFTDASLYELLEVETGVRIVRSDYTVRAEAATAEVAKLLGIEVGSPVLAGQEIGKDVGGNPIQLGRVVYRSDAYEFQATLFRRL